jgi:pseudouridine-5'-monophosphatase
VHIALATSSQTKNFKLKTAHLTDLFSVFTPARKILGDDPRIPPGRGKPLPDIYLVALGAVNEGIRAQGNGEPDVKPEECLVFEDSVPGVEAGRRAGMRVIWCPHPGLREEYRGREEEVLAGATGEHKEAAKSEDERLAEKIGSEMQKTRNHGDGKPGEIGDGWGEFLETLERFPYERYGIQIP